MSELETVFFIHVPKTAGTSFRMALERTFPDRLAFDYGRESSDTTDWVREHVYDAPDRDRFRRELVERGIVVFGGHVGRSHYGDVFEPERTISFVRDPVQRVISEWHHHRRRDGIDTPLEEFAAEPAVRNMQARLLGGCPLHRYAVLGRTSHYPESLELIRRRLGWDLPHLSLNANPELAEPGDAYEVSPQCAARIAELNEHDLRLYERALRVFEKRLDAELPARPDAPVRGVLDRYEDGSVYGWACRLGDPTPLTVRVLVDDREVCIVPADRVRSDLRDKGIHRTGRAGFRAEIGALAPDTTIRCLVDPGGWELNESPHRVGGATAPRRPTATRQAPQPDAVPPRHDMLRAPSQTGVDSER